MIASIPSAYEQRQAQIARERGVWPVRYATVREAMERGFWPDAYGGAEPPALLRPPTKFAYPAGGLAHPHHVNGKAAGSRFWIWCHADGSPDELRDHLVWSAGDPAGWKLHLPSRSGLTFDQAIAACEELGAYFRAHFVVPTWHGERPDPALTTSEWRELLRSEGRSAALTQVSMFEPPPPPTPLEHAQQVIADLLRPLADDEPQVLTFARLGDLYDVERLIEQVNWRRARDLEQIEQGDSHGGGQ